MKASQPQMVLPQTPPPPPNPPMFGQDMPKKKGGQQQNTPTFLGGALAAQPGNVGQKTLLGQ